MSNSNLTGQEFRGDEIRDLFADCVFNSDDDNCRRYTGLLRKDLDGILRQAELARNSNNVTIRDAQLKVLGLLMKYECGGTYHERICSAETDYTATVEAINAYLDLSSDAVRLEAQHRAREPNDVGLIVSLDFHHMADVRRSLAILATMNGCVYRAKAFDWTGDTQPEESDLLLQTGWLTWMKTMPILEDQFGGEIYTYISADTGPMTETIWSEERIVSPAKWVADTANVVVTTYYQTLLGQNTLKKMNDAESRWRWASTMPFGDYTLVESEGACLWRGLRERKEILVSPDVPPLNLIQSGKKLATVTARKAVYNNMKARGIRNHPIKEQKGYAASDLRHNKSSIYYDIEPEDDVDPAPKHVKRKQGFGNRRAPQNMKKRRNQM